MKEEGVCRPRRWLPAYTHSRRTSSCYPIHIVASSLLPAQIERLLAGLDRGRSYFSVVHFAGLLAKEQVDIPCDLKLTLFMGGGPEDALWAPHITYVPIPLLLKVRWQLLDPRPMTCCSAP